MIKVLIFMAYVLTLSILGAVAGHWFRSGDLEAAVSPESYDSAEKFIFKFADPFVIPLIRGTKVDGIIILDLAMEIRADFRQEIDGLEPKLRAEILDTLFAHANAGYFLGVFTEARKMAILRENIFLKVIKNVAENSVGNVMITSILRQDR